MQLRSSGGRPLANCGHKLRAAGSGQIAIAGSGTYRGALEVVPTDSDAGSLNVVNAVPVDQYVKGVIPNESPASWPQAALRAQAVAARSYALTDARSAATASTSTTTPAARSTRASAARRRRPTRPPTRPGARSSPTAARSPRPTSPPARAATPRASRTSSSAPPIPYLVGVPDPYDGACPLHTWTLEFSGPEISARLGAYLDGRLKQVVVTKRGVSPRIVGAKLIGTGGVTKIRGDQLAAALGGYDRWMSFRKVVNGKVAGGKASRASPAVRRAASAG